MGATWEGKTEVVIEIVKAGVNLDLQDKVCQHIYDMYMYMYM